VVEKVFGTEKNDFEVDKMILFTNQDFKKN